MSTTVETNVSKRAIRTHYDLATPFYRLLWGPHIHHGLWERECSPQVRELTLKSAGLLEELGHRVEHVDQPPVAASFVNDFIMYWGFLALAQVRGGRHMFGATFDPGKLDSFGAQPAMNRRSHKRTAGLEET